MYHYDSRFVSVSCFLEQTVSSIICRCYEEKESSVEALIHVYNILDDNYDSNYNEPQTLKSRFNDLWQLKNKDPQLVTKFYPRAEADKLLEDEKYLKNLFVRLIKIINSYTGTGYSDYSSNNAKIALKRIKILQTKDTTE